MDQSTDIRYKPGLRNLSGLGYSLNCAIPHWLGFLLVCTGLFALAFGEYFVRVPIEPGPYIPNAFLAMLGPFLALAWADWYAIRTYRAVGTDLSRPGLRARLLDPLSIDGLRGDLLKHPLTRWFSPARLRTVSDHAAQVIRWYAALKHPEGVSLGRRLRVAKLATSNLVLLLSIGLGLLLWANQLQPWPWLALGQARQLLGWALLPLAGGSLLGGYMLIGYAARKQALLDYFALWKAEAQADHQSG